MNKKLFKITQILSIAVIYLIATALHFTYDAFPTSALAILFSAVNESVWEHIKIFAVGITVTSIIQLLWLKPPFKKYVVACTTALYTQSFLIALLYYLALFLNIKNTVVNLLIALVAVCVTIFVSYNLTLIEKNTEEYFHLAAMLLLLYFVMFFSFTIFPPKLHLFKDPVTNTYGISTLSVDKGAFLLNKM